MSREILDFYCGGQDDQGRTLDEILAWPDMELEAVHDFIQWLFPLPERSGANPSAPVLDRETIVAFHASEELQDRLRQSFLRMLRFTDWNFIRRRYSSQRTSPCVHPTGLLPAITITFA